MGLYNEVWYKYERWYEAKAVVVTFRLLIVRVQNLEEHKTRIT